MGDDERRGGAWARYRARVCVFSLAFAIASATAAAASDAIVWRDRVATMSAVGDGTFRLQLPVQAGGKSIEDQSVEGQSIEGKSIEVKSIEIAAQPLSTRTASPMFDGLFALAQQEMRQDQVTAIRDAAFDHGQPLDCDCYQTGEKWPYVWTRDLSFAADLALARLDPERTKRSLRFKLSDVRTPDVPQGLYVAQDTGSGGSWPISTDRVVWFLAARHLLDDPAFADEVWRALRDTLAQDRQVAFDPEIGLYRGETSFLDWREQTYPAWTAKDVRFIAESFALSTNVLHYQALQLAASLADERRDSNAHNYRVQAQALAKQIDDRFWNARRGMYMSYIGSAAHPVPFEAYDLLGISLAALSGAVPEARARESLMRYPVTDAGSPVIWPQQPGIPIYHNRAIWPFVSTYALKAARKLDLPQRISHELRSLMRGTALAGSNMENYELITQAVHVDDGALSGPVVNSPRQLWSVAGYLDMVIEGVFGVGVDGAITPKIPADLMPMLFGKGDAITLRMPDRSITLRRPRGMAGGETGLWIADRTGREGDRTIIDLRLSPSGSAAKLETNGAQFAPPSPDAPTAERTQDGWRIHAPGATTLYLDGKPHGVIAGGALASGTLLPIRATQQCLSVTRTDSGPGSIESLHSPTLCIGEATQVSGNWPRRWTAPADGRYRASLRYTNPHGPINTGITAAVKQMHIQCGDAPVQIATVVMPHSIGEQASTSVAFTARRGAACEFALHDGFNMSGLRHFARYTGGEGGASGPLNDASIGLLDIAQAP